MKRLTDNMLSRLKAPAKTVELRDAQEQGLLVRISPRKVMRWYWVHRRGGKLQRVNLGSFPAVSVAEARAKARQARLDVEGARRAMTVNDVFGEWSAIKRRRTVKGEESVAALRNHVLYDVGEVGIRQLTTQDALRPIRRRIEQGREVMASVALGLFKELLAYAVVTGHAETNVLAGITPRVLGIKRRSRDRVLTLDELRTVWNSDYESLVVELLQFLMLSFVRGHEARLMTWSMVKDDRIVFPAELMKMNRPHDLPITTGIETILERRRVMAAGNYVFIAGLKDKPVNRTFLPIRTAELRHRHRMAHFTPHDLRRCVTYLVDRLDVDVATADSLLAHQPVSGIAAVYQRGSLFDRRREALVRWERWLVDQGVIQV